jgi:hypothetical protein
MHVLQEHVFVNTHFPTSVEFTKGEEALLEQEKNANKIMVAKKWDLYFILCINDMLTVKCQ